MPVVTLTGTIGSGAREVGLAVARLLEVDFVDQQLMVRAAQRCGVSVGAVAEHDERTTGFRARISSVFNTLLERSAISGADPLTGASGLEVVLSRTYADLASDEREERHLSDSLYMDTMTAVIRELAFRGDIVILGRGSQMVLADMPGATHVLCVAPRDLRVQRLAEREGIDPEEAKHRAHDGDRARDAFYRKFWKVDVSDPKLYDLTVNTARMPDDISAHLVATAARTKERPPD